MYNTDIPTRAELPSSKQLVRSTVIAAVSAVVLLFTVVLPSEYGVDPTGIGRVLGLTEMGEIKTRLAEEAAADAAASAASATATPAAPAAPTAPAATATAPAAVAGAAPAAAPAAAAAEWRDETRFTLTPGEGTEIKVQMREGQTMRFSWSVQGGVVNYDTHGDALGKSISYEKGRAVPADEGELVAAFTGNHGWFFRNRGQADVTVVLRTGGEYENLKRVK